MNGKVSNLPVALIDYGMGNLRSVQRAFEASGAQVRLVSDPADVGDAKAVIFPGQGAIVDTMRELKSRGFDSFLKDWIFADKPFFGICLGLQMLFEHSEEGDTQALGICSGRVRRFSEEFGLKIPHMGWNTISIRKENAGTLSDGIAAEGVSFYFVHSYFVDTPDKSLVWSETEYGVRFVSGIRRGNLFATQFHPEKSQEKGLLLYKNFLSTIG